MAFFTLTVLIYVGQHGVHGFGAGAFKPTWLVFLAATPTLIFDLEGFELPSAASEELNNPRKDVPFAILRSGIGTVLFYGVPILAILPVLPASRLSSVTGFLDALQQVFVVCRGHLTSSGAVLTGAGKALADIAAVGVILGLLSSAVVWLIGSDWARWSRDSTAQRPGRDPALAAKLTRAQVAAALKQARRRNIAGKTTAILAALRGGQLGQPAALTAAYAATV